MSFLNQVDIINGSDKTNITCVLCLRRSRDLHKTNILHMQIERLWYRSVITI